MRGVAASFAVALLSAFAISGAAAQQTETIERAYSPLDLDKCRHKPGREVEDYGSWRCAGHAGIAVFVTAGDQRSYISFGPNAANERAAQQTLSAFNSAGKTIEWRIERKAGKPHPFATILRWNTTTLDPADDLKQVAGQVLVVTRLGPGGVCHVGYVDGRANADANALAVRLADEHARAFKCGKDKPIVVGVQGPGFSALYGGGE